jgi:hypothetical protein
LQHLARSNRCEIRVHFVTRIVLKNGAKWKANQPA